MTDGMTASVANRPSVIGHRPSLVDNNRLVNGRLGHVGPRRQSGLIPIADHQVAGALDVAALAEVEAGDPGATHTLPSFHNNHKNAYAWLGGRLLPPAP